MTSNESLLAHIALGFVPPLVRQSLLEDKTFVDNYGIQLEPVLSIGRVRASFSRKDFYGAIRKSMESVQTQEVFDVSGKKWEIQRRDEDEMGVQIGLSDGQESFTLPDMTALAPDVNVRLTAFDLAASDLNLPEKSRSFWRNLLEKRFLHDDELDALHDDLGDTPINISRAIKNEIANGAMEKSSLVPHSRRYFDRLIGEYDNSASLSDFVKGNFQKTLSRLLSHRSYDGFLHALILSSHSLITDSMDIAFLDKQNIVKAFDYIDKYGDVTSQVGAIEVGLRIITDYPEIQPVLVRVVKRLRDDDVNEDASDFMLFSTLFILVYGELSRTRLLANTPPFYRRLAALSQAALIHRQLIGSNLNVDQFNKKILAEQGVLFYTQAYADMRLEPRWYPDLITPAQIKADYLGRVIIAAKKNENSIQNGALYKLILSDKPSSLFSSNDKILPYLPGPLEGAEEKQKRIPLELTTIINTQLNAEQISPSSFTALVNSALFFTVGKEQAELAAKALELANHRLANIADKGQLLGTLRGLAIVAAISRNRKLTQELRTLTRRYKQDHLYKLGVEEILWIYLVSGASYVEINEWQDFIGECFTELAFGELKIDDGIMLHSHLRGLCHVSPELWVSCGRADAALMAFEAIDT